MLVLSTLSSLLAQLVTPSLHTAILSTPQGHLVAFACEDVPTSEDRLRILVGLSSEVWRNDDIGTEGDDEEYMDRQQESTEENNDDQVGMLECEVSRVSSNTAVYSIHATGKAVLYVRTLIPQLGRLLVLPIYALTPEKTTADVTEPHPVLLLSLNGVIDEPWGLMHTKVSKSPFDFFLQRRIAPDIDCC